MVIALSASLSGYALFVSWKLQFLSQLIFKVGIPMLTWVSANFVVCLCVQSDPPGTFLICGP